MRSRKRINFFLSVLMFSVNFIKLTNSGGDSQSDDLSDLIAQVDEALVRVQDRTNNDISEIIPKIDALIVFIENAIVFFKEFSTNQELITKLQTLHDMLIQLKLLAKSNSPNQRKKRNIDDIQTNDCDRARNQLIKAQKVLESNINMKEEFNGVAKVDFDDFDKNIFDDLNSKQLSYIVHVTTGLKDLQNHAILNENSETMFEAFKVIKQVMTKVDIVCGPKNLKQPIERKLPVELIFHLLNLLSSVSRVKASLFLFFETY